LIADKSKFSLASSKLILAKSSIIVNSIHKSIISSILYRTAINSRAAPADTPVNFYLDKKFGSSKRRFAAPIIRNNLAPEGPAHKYLASTFILKLNLFILI